MTLTERAVCARSDGNGEDDFLDFDVVGSRRHAGTGETFPDLVFDPGGTTDPKSGHFLVELIGGARVEPRPARRGAGLHFAVPAMTASARAMQWAFEIGQREWREDPNNIPTADWLL